MKNNKFKIIMFVIYSIYIVVLLILDFLLSESPFYTVFFEEPSFALYFVAVFLLPFILFYFYKKKNNNSLLTAATIIEIILIVIGLFFWFIWPFFKQPLNSFCLNNKYEFTNYKKIF